MPKYEVIVEKTETYIILTEQDDEEHARQYTYEMIQEGNAIPYFEDWLFDMTEK